ncbi:hypothetical protein GGR92_005262 [Spirosoma lacussanchae]|uniref:hypothetical protein n=1 Tax=Spirosoma lacussanchae TaxID=1884249 RepID=UPI001109C84B|nr:hypothetical protein [Spirosoma lacussanchae]
MVPVSQLNEIVAQQVAKALADQNAEKAAAAIAAQPKQITVNQYRMVNDGFGDAKKVDEQVQIYSEDEYRRLTSPHPQDDSGRTVAEVLGLVIEPIEE